MKKLLLSAFLVAATFSYAQVGISAGYSSGKAKISGDGVSISSEDSAGAFSIGLFADLELDSSIDFQPYIAYGIGEKVEDESNTSIGFGGNFDLYPMGRENGLFFRGGVGVGISLMDVDTDLIKKSATSGVIGLGLDVSENAAIILGYSTQLSDSSNISGIEIKATGIGAQLQVKF